MKRVTTFQKFRKKLHTLLPARLEAAAVKFKIKTNFIGILMATSWFTAALTPSLVPRPWHLQGLAAGIALVVGYYIGTGLSALWRRFVKKEPKKTFKNIAWIFLTVWVVIVPAYELGQSLLYQRKLSIAITGQWEGDAHISIVVFGTLVVTAFVAAILVRIITAIHGLYVRLHGYFIKTAIIKKVPSGVFRASVALFIVVVISYLATDAGLRFMRDTASGFFKAGNMAFSPKYKQPTSPLLSGGDDSLVSWESLGAPGRQFVAAQPSKDQLQEFYGKEAIVQQPIRAYVGIEASNNIREQARLAVKELERTGAFDREVIQIVSTTGSGGVDLSATRPLEYMYKGDTATVAIQYSYFPSWLSLITDRERAKTAAQELMNQVYAARKKHGSTAKMYVFGESLGSYGIEAAYPSTEKLLDRSDRALLVGAPGFNPIRKPLREGEKNDEHVAAVGGLNMLPSSVHDKARVAYLENQTDPVIRWDPELIWKQPDWIYEQRKLTGDAFTWYPFVSFLQVTVDMALALDVPVGYGHKYGVETSRVWAELVDPPGWNAEKQHKLEATLLSFYF